MRPAPSPPPPCSLMPACYMKELRFRGLAGIRVDALLEDGRRLEHHHPAWRDRHFLPGLGIAPNPLALLAHHERAERGQLHRFATFEAIGDLHHHRSRIAPQVKPPPMASSITRSPRLMRPSAIATESASGIEAAEVLPCLATVLTTFSGAMPSFLAESSMMRWLA